MALRLGSLVACGEINNTRHYSVCGWLQLRDNDQPLILQLTGNCDPDLAGRHIRFQAGDADPSSHEVAAGSRIDFSALAGQQVGPTGTMTAARMVKHADCPPAKLPLRRKPGEPSPLGWKRCLYLEWFSQNGRVVVELVDPIIKFVDPCEHGQPEELPGPAAERPPEPARTDEEDLFGLGPEATSAGLGQDGDAETWEEDFAAAEAAADEEEHEGCEDPYGLIPDHLREQFEAAAYQTDQNIQRPDDDEDKPRALQEAKLMDELIETGEGVPLNEVFDGPLKLPRPQQLTDDEAEKALKSLLAQLALFGVSLDVCEHFTPRDAYRLLLEQMCREETAFPELRETQWVQTFGTSDYCPQCQAEFEREHRQHERRRSQDPDEQTPPDEDPFEDDLPF